MGLEELVNKLPEQSVLTKRDNGLWYFYENESHYNEDDAPLHQIEGESFKEFIRQIVGVLDKIKEV